MRSRPRAAPRSRRAAQAADGVERIDSMLETISAAPPALVTPALAHTVAAQQLAALFPSAPAPDDVTYPVYEQLSSLVDELEALDAATPGEDVVALVTDRLGGVRAALADLQQQAADALAALDAAPAQLEAAREQIAAGEDALDAGRAELASAQEELAQKEEEYEAGTSELAAATASAEAQIAAAQEELAAKEAAYEEARAAYDAQKPEAEEAAAEADLAQAREKLANLEAPGYSASTRREVPGGDGYKIYATVADIVDALARVFPILLYFIAALVTFTTMTRMVDEERIGAGTLKALGYADGDVALKFIMYGLISSMAGTAIGIVAGHTLLPWIVYNAYATKFVLPPIHLLFDPAVSAVAVALGLVSAVLPAWLAVRQELRDKPSELLLPKPPASGSKILLERIPFIWNRLSFTHKVTARNLFRYKKRMFMTVFGVAGAVVLLVAGFGTQYSISGISAEQFGQDRDVRHDRRAGAHGHRGGARRARSRARAGGGRAHAARALRGAHQGRRRQRRHAGHHAHRAGRPREARGLHRPARARERRRRAARRRFLRALRAPRAASGRGCGRRVHGERRDGCGARAHVHGRHRDVHGALHLPGRGRLRAPSRRNVQSNYSLLPPEF